jgi:NADH-quinone oxidoreductase subunit L
MRKMGGLRKYMPITWLTSLLGSLALIGAPGFAGFYSKDSIIEAVSASHLGAATTYTHWALLIGVFVTALYSFRMYFLVFHGKERMDHHTQEHLHESPWVVTLPLILLAIPSVVIGAIYVGPMVFGDFFGEAIYVADAHKHAEEFHGPLAMALHGLQLAPFWLALAGVVTAWLLYMKFTDVPAKIQARLSVLNRILENKYGFDWFNEHFFGGGSRLLGKGLWRAGDVTLIDGLLVNGSARVVGWSAALLRHLQSGYLYHYAFAMIVGLLALFGLFVLK